MMTFFIIKKMHTECYDVNDFIVRNNEFHQEWWDSVLILDDLRELIFYCEEFMKKKR
jgi:hypothetical protein